MTLWVGQGLGAEVGPSEPNTNNDDDEVIIV